MTISVNPSTPYDENEIKNSKNQTSNESRETASSSNYSKKEVLNHVTTTNTTTKRTHHRHSSSHSNIKYEHSKRHAEDKYESVPFRQAFYTFLSYFILHIFGHLREFLRKIGVDRRKGACDNCNSNFTPLYQSFDSFFTRNYYLRVRDVFNRPITGVPGAQIELVERVSKDYNWTYEYTGKTIKALNMGSYNYLGFAENNGSSSMAAIKSVQDYGVTTSSPRQELGTLRCHRNLESLLSRFLGVEDSITFGMGFATNVVSIPTLVGKNCLILSDELNHSSIILGCRLSGAMIKPFKHNNVNDLENKLKKAIIEGHPLTGRPWKKILIVVEGVYSMEGSLVPLPEIIALKKKYKAYLYLDEAHSIGAMGSTGRGVVEHFGCNPKDVDILMGTFSKSFGAAGGYIAGTKRLINYIRTKSHASCYASSMSAPVCMQILRTLEIIMGLDGTNQGVVRIKQLYENTIYFREKLVKMGFIVYGNKNSPVVPVMICIPSKVVAFNRMMLKKGIAVVTVGYPATPLTGARVRFCLSASHTREMLDTVLKAMDECGDYIGLKFSKRKHIKNNA